MQLIGYFALAMAFWFSLYSAGMHFYGGWSRDFRYLTSARRAVFAATAMAILAAVSLYHALLTHDFSIDYVARYSDRNLPLFYLISSFWAGHPGSLFLWGLELSIMIAVLAFM